MEQKMSQYKFYFSNKCKYCYDLAVLMRQRNLLHTFTIINVDYETIPDFIKTVPTIHVPYMKLLEGDEAFKWIRGCKEEYIHTCYLGNQNKKRLDRISEYNEILKDSLFYRK